MDVSETGGSGPPCNLDPRHKAAGSPRYHGIVKGGSSLRRRRPWIAAFLTLALAFSQALVAAYACPLGSPTASDAIDVARVAEAMPDCDGVVAHTVAPGNLCETHCLPGQQVQQADAPTPPLAAQPPLIVRVRSELAAIREAILAREIPATAAPPPRLRFGRLLI